jgi:hypothetical protein
LHPFWAQIAIRACRAAFRVGLEAGKRRSAIAHCYGWKYWLKIHCLRRLRALPEPAFSGGRWGLCTEFVLRA